VVKRFDKKEKSMLPDQISKKASEKLLMILLPQSAGRQSTSIFIAKDRLQNI